jgi:8-oxo-dGTP pyrophosphatase MutT (NUDIX family)
MSLNENKKAETGIHILARAVIVRNDQILLCKSKKHQNNFFFLPGGHVDPGEGAQESVVRELLEESGQEFEVKRFLGCLEYQFDKESGNNCCHDHELNLVFQLVSKHKPVPVVSQESHIELKWVSFDDLRTIDLRPDTFVDLLEKWLYVDFDGAFVAEGKKLQG